MARVAQAAQTPNTARVIPMKLSPNEKLNIAAIGAGGKGASDIMHSKDENIVALCDVDWDRAAEIFKAFPDVPKYRDYRNMLDKHPEIDAVTVSIPDHSHAPAAYLAMKMGKHVYVQKPLTHTVAEARLLLNTAREMGVVTQMGNQGHSGDGVREMCEMLWTGAIGQVREAHVWTDRPYWKNQGVTKPFPPQTTRDNLDWDRWIGAAPWRPFNDAYVPHDWRAWQDFGSGSLGDMACHVMDPVYMALKLGEATEYTVEVIMQDGRNSQTYPVASTIKYSFPARADMCALDVYWYDGYWTDPATGEKTFNRPKRPEEISEDCVLGDDNLNGSFFIGETGILTQGQYGGKARLVPDNRMLDYQRPDPFLPRIFDHDHTLNWIMGCKGGEPPCSNFEYSAPFAQLIQVGNLAVKTGKKLHWDNTKGVITNVRNASDFVSKEYRRGWELPV
jgi:predicted dehydrogenase